MHNQGKRRKFQVEGAVQFWTQDLIFSSYSVCCCLSVETVSAKFTGNLLSAGPPKNTRSTVRQINARLLT